jgi:ribosomal-protein-alanine acetyltransferase
MSELRRARSADAPAIAALAADSLPERWGALAFRAELEAPGGIGFVALAPDGELIGYAVGTRTLAQLEIRSLAVAAAHRRRGVGRALLARLLECERAHGVEDVILEVRSSNLAAQRLYRSAGFQTRATRLRYYADGEAALLMAVQL